MVILRASSRRRGFQAIDDMTTMPNKPPEPMELPPADSPESTVKVGVAHQVKRGKK